MSQMTRQDDGKAGSGRRRAVLGVLKDTAAALSISEIAEQVGVHPNTVRFHLETLTENGQVERVETDRHAPGRDERRRGPLARVPPCDPAGRASVKSRIGIRRGQDSRPEPAPFDEGARPW